MRRQIMATFDDMVEQQRVARVNVDGRQVYVPEYSEPREIIEMSGKDSDNYQLYSEGNDGTQQLQTRKIRPVNGQRFSTAVQADLGF
jgi:hypothetical protein